MKNVYLKAILLITYSVIFIFSGILPLAAQEEPAESGDDETAVGKTDETAAEIPEGEVLPPVPSVKISPVFPDSEDGLIFLEGESAVSTNFATSPVFNYGCSGFRSLQLIEQNAPYGGQAYFAEYAFYVEEAGDYYFWYGGTPPGPKEDVLPSFASPFRYILDGAEPVRIYREDTAVVEAYTPSYYWMEVGKVTLTKGVHRLRVEVPEKRRYDGRYYFFLDAFFFLREDRLEDELQLAPDLFPRNRLDRSVDNPFQSITFYEKAIQEDPGNKGAYIVLSMIYSLAGDYLNAIKNLNKAVNLDPEDPYPLLLIAKNRIWNGEVNEGLDVYQQVLTLAPDNPSYWAEAGKVAAWTGKYRESIDFFTRGLENFPDDLNLKVNLGLTYLWMARTDDAETVFTEAEDSAAKDHGRAMDLGSIHTLNGYPQYAVKIYNREIAQSPEYLESYLYLEESYRQMGETEKAEDTIQRVYETFQESPELSSHMTVYEEKKTMKDGILEDYRTALEEQPDNIPLRQLLAQTYFWNGLQKEAVDESLRILVNKMYIYLKQFDDRALDLLTLMDRTAQLLDQYREVQAAYTAQLKNLTAAKSAYEKALAAAEKKPEDLELSAQADELGLDYADQAEMSRIWMDRLTGLELTLEELRETWTVLEPVETNEEEVFRQLLGDSEWSWDRIFTQNELRKVLRDEPFLAGYILGRLALFAARPEEAVRYLNADVFEEDSSARYALYQTYLWKPDKGKQVDMWGSEADILTLYRQHLFDMEAETWEEPEPSGGFYPPGAEEADGILSDMADRLKVLPDERGEIGILMKEMRTALDRKLVRQIYYLEQETYLLRYSLGDYYLEMEENLKASRQYDRVLAMDPWNISANYKLGLVSQRYGDWSRAMEQYKKVYYQNPRYENAVYYYNQLARENADVLHFTAQNITDSSRITYHGEASYQSRINTHLGWGVTYRMDQDKMYRTFDEDGDGERDPEKSYRLHSFEVNVPVTLPEWNLVLTPVGGLYTGNRYFSDGNDPAVVPPPDSPDFGALMEQQFFKPYGGLSAGWNWRFLDTGASYLYKIEEDSLFPGRNLTRSHLLTLQASTYFPFEDKFSFGPVTTRTYGEFQFLSNQNDNPDRNRMGQIVQDASVGFVVSRKPLIRLTANTTLNLEDGTNTSLADYYVPDGVFEAKGGLRGTLSFHNKDYSESAEFSLWGSGGGYWTDILDQENVIQAVKLEGQFSAYYVKNAMMFYLIVGGNGTFNEGLSEPAGFWEFSASLGCRVNVPSLLTF